MVEVTCLSDDELQNELNKLGFSPGPILRTYAAITRGYSTIQRRQWHPLQYSCLENPMDGGTWWAAVHGVAKSRTRLRDFTFSFHFHALEREMATHSSVLAWRIPGTEEPDGLPSMGSQRVGHDWSDLAAAAAALNDSLWTNSKGWKLFAVEGTYAIKNIKIEIGKNFKTQKTI